MSRLPNEWSQTCKPHVVRDALSALCERHGWEWNGPGYSKTAEYVLFKDGEAPQRFQSKDAAIVFLASA